MYIDTEVRVFIRILRARTSIAVTNIWRGKIFRVTTGKMAAPHGDGRLDHAPIFKILSRTINTYVINTKINHTPILITN